MLRFGAHASRGDPPSDNCQKPKIEVCRIGGFAPETSFSEVYRVESTINFRFGITNLEKKIADDLGAILNLNREVRLYDTDLHPGKVSIG